MPTSIDCSLALPAPTVIPSSSTVVEDFLAVVYGDQDLLRAEFDAIIGAAWDDSPPRWPTPRPAASWPTRPRDWCSSGAVGLTDPRVHPHRPDVSGWVRQRSPPLGGSPPARPG
jgi:hypothetical protein